MSVKFFLMNQPAAETAGYLKNIHNCTEYRHSGLDPEASFFMDSCFHRNDKHNGKPCDKP